MKYLYIMKYWNSLFIEVFLDYGIFKLRFTKSFDDPLRSFPVFRINHT